MGDNVVGGVENWEKPKQDGCWGEGGPSNPRSHLFQKPPWMHRAAPGELQIRDWNRLPPDHFVL